MKRADFVKKFPIGSKLRLSEFSPDEWCEVLYHGETHFFCKEFDGDEWIYPYDMGTKWVLYEEKKNDKENQADKESSGDVPK